MSRCIFIIHPMPEVSAKVPVIDWSLSERGVQAAQRLLEKDFWKSVGVILSSPEPKAVTVAQMIEVKYDIQYSIEKDLREIDRYDTGFLPFEEYRGVVSETFKNIDTEVHGWESGRSVLERAMAVISPRMKEAAKKYDVVCISHEVVSGLVFCAAQGKKITEVCDPKMIGCYSIIDWDQKSVEQQWVPY